MIVNIHSADQPQAIFKAWFKPGQAAKALSPLDLCVAERKLQRWLAENRRVSPILFTKSSPRGARRHRSKSGYSASAHADSGGGSDDGSGDSPGDGSSDSPGDSPGIARLRARELAQKTEILAAAKRVLKLAEQGMPGCRRPRITQTI
jgi:hypothetical protein